MKRLINLGILLGIVLVIIGCQKEDFSPYANSWEKTNLAVDFTTPAPGTVFEPASDDRTGTGGLPGTVFEPASDDRTGTGSLPGTVLEPYVAHTPGVFPQHSGLETELPAGSTPNWNQQTTDTPILPKDINERNYSIHWQYEAPTDTKWQMVESSNLMRDIAIDNLCPYSDCDDTISQTVANLQVQANMLCQDLSACVACCSGGYVIYAMVIVHHECGIIDHSDF